MAHIYRKGTAHTHRQQTMNYQRCTSGSGVCGHDANELTTAGGQIHLNWFRDSDNHALLVFKIRQT
jgi:hypothetical protein